MSILEWFQLRKFVKVFCGQGSIDIAGDGLTAYLHLCGM